MMDPFILVFPKLLAALGMIVAAVPALAASQFQSMIDTLSSIKYSSAGLLLLRNKTTAALAKERDKASSNQKVILLGLFVSVASLIVDGTMQFMSSV
jgi:hypothetical protein